VKYDVTVQRVEYREHVFRVDGENDSDAFHAGLEAACDYDFHNSPVYSASENVDVETDPCESCAKCGETTCGGDTTHHSCYTPNTPVVGGIPTARRT
jgi:hypothetical protein